MQSHTNGTLPSGIELVTLADIEQYSGTFGTWLQQAMRSGDLHLAVHVMVTKGIAFDLGNAIALLERLSHRFGDNTARLTLQDQKGAGRGHHWGTELKRALGISLNGDVLHRQLGVLSHVFVGLALQGIFPGLHVEQKIEAAQLGLFGSEIEIPEAASAQQARVIDRMFWKELAACVQVIERAIAPQGIPAARYIVPPEYLTELRRLLRPLFGPDVDRYKPDDLHSQYLVLLALLAWAKAALLSHERGKHNPTYFREVPVFNWRFGVSGGFMDLIRVTSVNGKPLNKRQEEAVRKMAAANPRHSVGYLIFALEAILGGTIGVEVLDMKFMVGDGTATNHMLDPISIAARPVGSHVKQVNDYAQRVHISRALETGRTITQFPVDTVDGVELDYFLPKRVIHVVAHTPTPNETWDMMQTTLPEARERAMMRKLSNLLFGAVVKMADGNTIAPISKDSQTKLFRKRNRDSGYPMLSQGVDDWESLPHEGA